MLNLKSGVAYNTLAKNLNAIYLMLNDVIVKVNNKVFVADDYFNDVCFLAYASRVGVIELMEEYQWSMNGHIYVDAISLDKIPLTIAFQETIGRIMQLGLETGLDEWVSGILEKNHLFSQYESILPKNLRETLFS